jgi:hypothetical protein
MFMRGSVSIYTTASTNCTKTIRSVIDPPDVDTMTKITGRLWVHDRKWFENIKI